MSSMNHAKQHWEKLYATKEPHEVSWTQARPAASLSIIHSFALPKQAPILDVGGGDSRLVDYLLDEGYENLTMLDISATALAKAKYRLGERSQRVRWIEADIREFVPDTQYAVWHDRAAFHFLTNAGEADQYLHRVLTTLLPGGNLILGTFSTSGPDRCSGLPVRRYCEQTLAAQMPAGLAKIDCLTQDHITPFHATQSFLFCSFRREVSPLTA